MERETRFRSESGFLCRALRACMRWALERLYHECAFAYEAVAWLVSAGQWAEWRERVIPHLVGRRVLEIGCGTGKLLVALANAGLEAYGVDLSWPMARRAAQALRRRGEPAERVQRARAQQLPYGDATFNAVTFTFPTPYALCPETMREAWRVLRPGGRLVAVDGGWRTSALTSEELPYAALARDAGFRVVCQRQESRLFAITLMVAEKGMPAGAVPR